MSKKQDRERQQESLKVNKKKDIFVTHFFETQEGKTALLAMDKDNFMPVLLAPNLKDLNKSEIEDLNNRAAEYQ